MANVNLGIQVLWTGNNVEANLAGVESRLDQITESVRTLAAGFDRMADQHQRATRRMNDDFGNLRRGLAMLIRDFRTLGLFFVGTLGGRVLGGLVQVDAAYRKLLQGLVLTEGSAGGARAKILELANTAVDLGANVEATSTMYQRFAINGVENSDKLALAINGMAASLGIGREQAERTGVALSQMFAKGQFVRAEEFNQQLADNMPQAIAAAAEGFRRLGNTSLDTTQKISAAVQAGTLRTKDFAAAIIEGSQAMINTSAAVLNARTQIENFMSTLGLAAGASEEFSVVGGSIGIVFNAATKAILEYLGVQEQMSDEAKADAIRRIVDQIVNMVAAIEAATRATADFAKLAISAFGLLFDSARATGAAIASMGSAIARGASELMDPFNEELKKKNKDMERQQDAFLRGLSDSIERNAVGLGESFNNLASGVSFQTPLTDKLREQLAKMDIDKIVREAGRSSGLNLGTGGGTDTAGAAKAQRLQDRLTELMEALDGVRERARRADREGMTPLQEAMEKAQDPFRQVQLRAADLITDFQKLEREGIDVSEANQALVDIYFAMGNAMDEASQKAEKLFRAQQRAADALARQQRFQVQEQVADFMMKTDVRFEGEGPEQLRQIERDLNRERMNNATTMFQLEAQLTQQLTEMKFEEATNTQLLLEAHQNYNNVLAETTPAMILAAQRMQQLVQGIRSAFESAFTDMFTGLVNEGFDFDWDAWASNLIGNITSAIAANWAKGLTDSVMDMLGLGAAQAVKVMNVQTMNVQGTGGPGGAAAGGFQGILSGLFGGGQGGGGGGGIMDWISAAGKFMGFFSKGGVMNGHITPFANGGVVGGPTLFGMAGEKGKEGILPLQRVGGKLGVSAEGGGNHYSISIQAIDTQSGAEFLMKNMDTVIGGLDSARSLGTFR